MIFQLLTDEDIAFCKKELNEVSYADGKQTQNISKLYSIKENKVTPIETVLGKYVSGVFLSNTTLNNIYNPSMVNMQIVNKYGPGDFYDFHVDPFENSITGMANSFGFSIALNDNYEGGEFVIDGDGGRVARKLQTGQIIVFPVMYPHAVQEVTKGTRQNIIGWFSSNISFEQAYMLKHLNDVVQISKGLVTDNSSPSNKDLLIKSVLLQKYIRREWSK